MTHPKLQLSRLLDWIRFRIECDDPSPTDDQIVELLGLDLTATARSMLADLADRGDITIKGSGPARQIALGRQHRAIETPRPVPSVVKPKRAPISEQECAARIQAIMSAGKKKQPDSPAAEMEAPGSGEGERRDDAIVQPVAPSVPFAAPPSFEPKRLPTAPDRRIVYNVRASRQINVRLDQDALDEIKRRANGRSVTGTATAILAAALRAEPGMTIEHAPSRFRIPAEVTRAAIRDGIPVLDLAAALMMRGLGSFERDAAREQAA